MPDPCPECGKDRTLVGYRHLCVPPVTKNVTVTKCVTRPVTASVTQQCKRCAELEAEVKRLKRMLAEQNKPVAMTSAERVRRYRVKKRDA
jgi:hypothetical protein